MLQLDGLLTFATGAALATAAGDGLKASHYHTQNKYFVFTLLHLILIVAPLNVYMLWEHTGFETLFYYDASINGIWPALNIPFFTLCGIAGFMSARKLVRINRELTAYTLWMSAYTVTLASISAHYDRLLYPGGIREFYEGKKYELTDFVNSELCQTLVVSLLLMAGPVFYAQIFWPREEGYMTKARKSTIKWHCLGNVFKQGCGAAIIFTVLKLAHLTPAAWGWDRLFAIGVGHLVGFTLLLLPIFLISTRYVVTPRIDIRRSKQNQQLTRRRRPSRSSQNNTRLYNMNEENVYAEWEDNNADDDQESTNSEIRMNGNASNGHVAAKQD